MKKLTFNKSDMKSYIILAAVFAVCITLNIAARLSVSFSDWYRIYIFPVLQSVFSRISGVFPFSVGELMIVLAIFGGLAAVISYAALMLVKKNARMIIALAYLKTTAWLLAVLLTVQTLNFFILYHCSTFAQQYGMTENEYTSEQLFETAVLIAEKTNAASRNITRGQDGRFMLTADPRAESAAAMRNLGEAYPSFRGYYPKPKPLTFSHTATRLNLLGVYYPFSFEANYNAMISDIDKPTTLSHELAHLKGWMLEDEANFISFLACIYHDNPEFVYSGYATALRYIWSKVRAECSPEKNAELTRLIDPLVWGDLYHRSDIFRAAREEKIGAVMSEVSETAIEVNLRIQGVPDGAKSYGRFVDLLLNYYVEN